nr:uncharacterized protein LOC127328892 [Lolium perenne]
MSPASSPATLPASLIGATPAPSSCLRARTCRPRTTTRSCAPSSSNRARLRHTLLSNTRRAPLPPVPALAGPRLQLRRCNAPCTPAPAAPCCLLHLSVSPPAVRPHALARPLPAGSARPRLPLALAPLRLRPGPPCRVLFRLCASIRPRAAPPTIASCCLLRRPKLPKPGSTMADSPRASAVPGSTMADSQRASAVADSPRAGSLPRLPARPAVRWHAPTGYAQRSHLPLPSGCARPAHLHVDGLLSSSILLR